MAKYAYPALFTHEADGKYSVSFPDVPGCYSGGDDLPTAFENAQDALCLMLYDMEENGETIPPVSEISGMKTGKNEFASIIMCDTLEYRQLYDTRSVKKTLTIPAWLNTAAEREGVNFSQALQGALKRQLGIANYK